jgi:uncharacterized membrane protein HdeD (DUF308 family)
MAKARALLVATSALLVAATLAAYAGHVLFGSEQFADRATAALRDTSVREAIAERVTDELLLPAKPDLLAARPIVVSAVSGVVGGDAFASLFRRGVLDVHRAVFRRDQDTVTLTLADVGIVVAAALRELRPELASELGSDERIVLLERDVGAATGDLARLARDVRVLAFVLAALALAAAIGAVAMSPDRRWAVARLGVAVAVAGVVIVVGETLAGALVLDRVGDPDSRAAAAAVWDAFVGDLRTAGWVIAGSGAVVAAAAASLIRPIEIEPALAAAWRAVTTEPAAPLPRVVRAALLVAFGLLAILAPAAVMRIVASVVGVYVLYKGIEALLRLIDRPVERTRPRRRAWRFAVPVVATLLIVAAIAAFAAGGGVDEPVPEVSGCNGHEELCDRPLDEVALAATHNSMSVPLPGWFASLQERPIGDQLEDGIRGLLLDTHYADLLANGRHRTYFASREDLRSAVEEDGASAAAVEAAERLRDRLGFRGPGEPGMYLCHTFCELGATPIADVLEDIREFLVTHPGDVLVVINQDYVTPPDFVAAIDDAGLTRYAFEPPSGSSWPTLGEMIEQDRRLVVLAENEAGAAPWYQLVYERLTQETPFSFSSTEQLTAPDALAGSCRPNRGEAGAPLFLVNHWVNTDPLPLPSNATVVNAYEPLLRRARACGRERGRPLNLLAVDFYTRGDVFEVVDTLNAVGARRSPP